VPSVMGHRDEADRCLWRAEQSNIVISNIGPVVGVTHRIKSFGLDDWEIGIRFTRGAEICL
jgi:hypothetical protein